MSFWNEILEGLRISWSAIKANQMRSVLTTLGVVIGIVTVTMMATAINGLNAAFLRSMSILGTDVVYVERFGWFMGEGEWRKSRNRPEITLAQAREVERQATLAKAIAPTIMARENIVFERRSGGMVTIIGTTDQSLITGGMDMSEGRFLSAADVAGARPICVVGNDVAERMFPRDTPVGKRLRVGDMTFEVVGTVAKRGRFLGLFSLDDVVFIPVTAMAGQMVSRPDVRLDVKVASLAQLDDAKEELEGIMRKVRRIPPGGKNDFAINQQDAFIQNFNKVGGTVAAVGLFITGLSLFVGGIGIMNIMFVSVTERTREIGVRRALGAKRRTILIQFLIESVLLCLMGGVIALVICAPMTLLVAMALPAALSPGIIALALGVAMVTGIISGFMPAWRAAHMSPVDALRSE
jgi:putative ABC transport system permease protein